MKNEVDRHAVLLVRKSLNGDVCSNFKDYFNMKKHHLGTRSRKTFLQTPKVNLEIAKNGFFFMGAKLYNLLPIDISESADDFEDKLNSFFIISNMNIIGF